MLIFQLDIQALSCVELLLVSAGSAKEKRFGACALLVDVPLPVDLQDAMGGPWRFRWDITISHGHRTWFEGLSCGSCHPRKSGFRVDILRCCWGRCFSTQDLIVFWVLEAAVANCSSVHLIVDRTVTRVDCVGWFTPFSEDLEGFCGCSVVAAGGGIRRGRTEQDDVQLLVSISQVGVSPAQQLFSGRTNRTSMRKSTLGPEWQEQSERERSFLR